MPSTLVTDILDAFAELDGGIHNGFRPVHAKGFMYSGTFTPSPGAAKLTRAPHASRPSTPVTVRFSGTTGVPTGSDTDPMGASPQGIAIRFHLADHVHVTDSTSIWLETRNEAEFGILTIKERVDELAPERRKMIFDPLPRVDGIDSAGDPIA